MDLSTLIGWLAGVGFILFSIVLNKDIDTGSYSIIFGSLKAFFDLP